MPYQLDLTFRLMTQIPILALLRVDLLKKHLHHRLLILHYGSALGDSFAGEDHGRAIYFDDNDSYIDLSPHSFLSAAENEGTISFWIKTTGRDENGDPADQNVFSAICLDDNASFFRIMVRDIGVMQLHAVNDGTEIAKFYTSQFVQGSRCKKLMASCRLCCVGEKSSFWIDGKRAESKTYAAAEGESASGDKRAFFSDIENLDYRSNRLIIF